MVLLVWLLPCLWVIVFWCWVLLSCLRVSAACWFALVTLFCWFGWVLFVYLTLSGGFELVVIWLMIAWFAHLVGCWLDLVLYLLAAMFWACATRICLRGGWWWVVLVLFLVFGWVCGFECLVGIVTCVILDGFTVGLVWVALVGLGVCGWCCDS